MRSEISFYQILGPIEFLLGKLQLRRKLLNVRFCFIDSFFSERGLRLRCIQLRGKIACVHDGKRLPGFYEIALISEKLEDPAGKLCLNIDFIRFQSAIAGRDAGR